MGFSETLKNMGFVSNALVLVIFIAAYYAFIIAYRLVFAPLAGFPGSRVAAATGWVEFYHDYFKEGSYIFEIEKMHRKYGKPFEAT